MIKSTEVELYLNVDDNSPKGRFKGKSIKDITLILIGFILPLGGIAQHINYPIKWDTKIVQVTDDLFEIHLKAKMNSGYFTYPINQPDCDWAPTLSLSRSSQWEAVGGPDLYYSANKIKNWKCFPLPVSLCNPPIYLDSAIFIQSIRKVARTATIEARLDYYILSMDSTGVKLGLEIKHSTHPKVDSILQTMVKTPRPVEDPPGYTYANGIKTYCGYVSYRKKRKFVRRAWWRIKHPFLQ